MPEDPGEGRWTAAVIAVGITVLLLVAIIVFGGDAEAQTPSIANPANPVSPLSPANPANPASPLNPMNQDGGGESSDKTTGGEVLAGIGIALVLMGALWLAITLYERRHR
jgi:hypothetical protein